MKAYWAPLETKKKSWKKEERSGGGPPLPPYPRKKFMDLHDL